MPRTFSRAERSRLSAETAAYIAIAALIVGALALLLALWVLLRARRLSRLSRLPTADACGPAGDR